MYTFSDETKQMLAEVTHEELFLLAAKDSLLYSHHFFPRTFRQTSPPHLALLWQGLERPDYEFFGAECFRGSAKTTTARAWLSKRIAYGLCRTGFFLSAAQIHAERSLRWLKKQVEWNHRWASFYGLRKGSKWRDDEIEIINDNLGITSSIVALGITGQSRGINLDDYRPDTGIADDPCDEESTGTEAQRKKQDALFFGSLQQGLAPRSEAPHAKIALLQTGLHPQDLINQAHRDSLWHTMRLPVFKYDDQGVAVDSVWPERFTFDELKRKKRGFMDRNQLHLWLREMECKIVSAETSVFNMKFLRTWETLPTNGRVYCGIDPASSQAKDAHRTAIVFWLISGPAAYLVDYFQARGKNPEEIWNAYYQRAMQHRPAMTGVESISYQRTLKWYMEKRMRELNAYFPIREYQDRRKKQDRIASAHSARLYGGGLYVHPSHTEYIDGLTNYTGDEDIDLLDAGAIALDIAAPVMYSGDIEGEFEEVVDRDAQEYGELKVIGGCP